jgi:hypothetical protein
MAGISRQGEKMKRPGNYLIVLLLSVCVLCGAGCKQETSCEPGIKQSCYCPDGTVKEQTCRDDGKGWDACQCTYYSVWCDDSSGLCWQDPQKDGYDNTEGGVEPADAVRYCEQVAFGGYADWRLPTIEELRTLVRGNPATETGGECPLVNDSVSSDMNDPACMPVTLYGGPGTGTAEGCYWPPELTGTCNKPDPASKGHPLEYASSTRCPDDPTKGWYGTIMFENGAVCWNHINTFADVRCVRDAPTPIATCTEEATCMPGATRKCIGKNFRLGAQVCAEEGNCWGPCDSMAFKKSPPRIDVCPSCDQIKLTIRVPEKLAVKPAQLMAFLYAADTWTWPPNRQPDGGNSDCQVKDPVIDVDTPFTLTVPACTYYRMKCLKGQYMLYVAILQTDTMPPVMKEGDYWWGMDQEPLTLGDGTAKEIPMDITLVPWTK